MAEDTKPTIQELIEFREEMRAGFARLSKEIHADSGGKRKVPSNEKTIKEGYNSLVRQFEEIEAAINALGKDMSRLRAVIIKEFGEKKSGATAEGE